MDSEKLVEVNGHGSAPPRAHIPPEVLNRFSVDSRECIQRLLDAETPAVSDFGQVKQGAVLVALFERPGGELEVLLTTRAKTMRRHPSQTALPGGKTDPEDPSPYHTARREAFEEVDLPLDSPSIHYINTLEPVITVLPLGAQYRNHIAVTPVVALISDSAIIDKLKPNPEEVDYIFSHPLRGVLTGSPGDAYTAGLVELGGEWWPHEEALHSVSDRLGVTGPHRMHRFRTSRSPIKGLTADILIHTAMISFGRETTYSRWAPGQPRFPDLIRTVVRDLPAALEQDERDRVAGKVVKHGPVEWGALDGGPGVKSGETWSTA